MAEIDIHVVQIEYYISIHYYQNAENDDRIMIFYCIS